MLAVVTWTSDWYDFEASETDHTDYQVRTVGWITGEENGYVHVAGEKTPDGYRAVRHIPRAAVVNVERVRSVERVAVGG